jgi:predicted ATPase
VPYKALDGVVDSLSRYLASLPSAKAEGLMPRDVAALAQVFPVMTRVDAVAAAPRRNQSPPDLPILRRRAFAALRELLARIADRTPVVISIDDLHWADADSAVLLEDLLRPPGAPALLMVVCFRAEEVEAKPFLLAPLQTRLDTVLPLSLGPMADEEARELIASSVQAGLSVTQHECQQIAREAGGNPFFLEQFARHLAIGQPEPGRARTLADVLDARLGELPPGARDFLETLAVCARPVAPSLVFEACGLSGDERPLVAQLRAANFIRSSGSAEYVEIYHDRIRDALDARLGDERRRRIHHLMRQSLASRRVDDPEALFAHCLGAGDRDGAAIQAELAAKKVDAALAFDRAAAFYRHALELAPQAAARQEWKEALATALANAGRPADAAEAYLEAAAGAERFRRVELERRGAEQFLIGGHMQRGVQVLRTVLEAVGMSMPRHRRPAFGARMADDSPRPAALARLDVRRAQSGSGPR